MVAPSQFEVGSNSTIVLDPASVAMAFFTRFDQPKVNDLDPADFWGVRSPYVDFHGFRVLGSVLPIWRQSIGAVGTSCRVFFSAVLQGNIS